MTRSNQPNSLSIGFAMFSMFFGSGNIVFPVIIGQSTGQHASVAIVGLILTAVVIPLLGLISMSMFDGNYMSYFGQAGRKTGWALVLLIMGLIGPLAVIPRCIIISHGTIAAFVDHLSLPLFSFFSCLLIYLCTYKPRRILDVLGVYLTPLLLLCLATIIAFGFLAKPEATTTSMSGLQAFQTGLVQGYNTMDLFAAFMFCNIVLAGIKKSSPEIIKQPKQLMLCYLKSSTIGMGLLALIYAGMCLVASYHAKTLAGVGHDKILSTLTLKLLGPYAGIIVCLAVSLACLTTAISLVVVFTEFLQKEVLRDKIGFQPAMIATLLLSFVISTLQFEGIQGMLIPILKISLPSFIVLTFANMLSKFSDFKFVKLSFFVSLAISLLWQVVG